MHIFIIAICLLATLVFKPRVLAELFLSASSEVPIIIKLAKVLEVLHHLLLIYQFLISFGVSLLIGAIG